MKDQRVYLREILARIQRIRSLTQNGQKVFEESVDIQEMVLYNFVILGETVKRLSTDFRDGYKEIPWRQMAGFRDFLIHKYDHVSLTEVWRTVERDLPNLMPKIAAILQKLEEDAD